MIKIAVVGTRGFPGVQGGVEKHCEELYSHLAQKKCSITVFTREPYIKSEHHTYKGVSLVSVSCPKNKYFEAFIHTFRSILKARKLKPDILHIHAIGPSLFAPLARAFGMKTVVTSHGQDYKRKKWNFFSRLFIRFCEFTGIIFANKIIAVSNNIASDIKNKFGREAAVIPNGTEIPVPAESRDILRKFGLDKQDYVLAVGRFVPEKGFEDLIDAFNEKMLRGLKLVIVGNADYENNYSLKIKEKAGKNTDIILTGILTGILLKEINTYAGLFVLPSYYEGMSIALLEAMSYGLSCIVSDIPANREMEIDKDRYFKPGDVKGLCVKIRKFADKTWEESEREKQIEMIRRKYSWDKIALKTFNVYNNINL